jgi:L-ribulose-5-phosphate 3-epimerase UlaE
MSRRELAQMAPRVREWQDRVEKQAKDGGFDVLRLSQDQNQFDIALLEWVAERRLRRH